MFDWSDLEYLLAVAECGSTLAAAKKLGVNQSTVQRRIIELERAMGHALVQRHTSGYKLTAFGETLLPAIQDMEKGARGVQRMVQAYASDLHGVIRLTCPEPLVSRLSDSSLLKLFHDRYPALRIEFVMSDRYLDLSKGEADVALRSGDLDDDNLVGRKIGDSTWAVYASRSYVQRHGQLQSAAEIGNHAIIGFDGILSRHRAAKWIASVAPNATVAARNDSVLGVLHAVKSGVGVAPLPTTIADMHDDLVQVLPPVRELHRGWYLLTHPDLRKTPRISSFFDFVIENLDLVRPILMG